ncbi:histidine phosphatase family protein [Paludifilum halophilum]|uniref:Alpha-ribazole phosphatase n=1 Tax=Paludifilum halophilum TaxID=1642702 RepID=A0A235B1M6_9BACL|nr:histidine phosphatase family protein [Paludifilum halophilum]OYD06183.1 hypothetical protein CHM34_17715 [Paludifilum halophilum]
MMRIIWLRHGETRANRERRYCGHENISLNERGWRQAEQAALRLARVPLTGLYCSDLDRCVRTAEAVEVYHPGIRRQPTPLLRELSFGAWEGLTYEEINSSNPEHLRRWIDQPDRVSPPGGERMVELEERLSRWLREVIETRTSTETVAVVSHGGPIRWFLSHQVWQDPDGFWRVRIPPGGCAVADWDGGHWTEVNEAEDG